MDDSPELKYNRLPKFYNQLNEFKKITSQTLNRKEKKKTVHNIANPLTIDCNDYINPDKLKEKMSEYYNPSNLHIQGYRFIESMNKDKEKSKSQPDETVTEKVILRKQKVYDDISSLEVDDSDEFIDIPDMPPLEGDEE